MSSQLKDAADEDKEELQYIKSIIWRVKIKEFKRNKPTEKIYKMSQLEIQADIPKKPKASGLKTMLHGIVYQLKLLMLFFKRGLDEEEFQLFTEVETAEKFDDLVFQYKNGLKNCRFLQAKHSQNKNKKITATDLLTEKGEFSLKKYFHSYRKIKKRKDFEGMKKDYFICTNINIDKELEKCFEKVDDDSKMLKFNKGSSRLLKFKIKNFPRSDDLVKRLKSCSDLRIFATALARWAVEERRRNFNKNHIFNSHLGILREIVYTKRSKRMGNGNNNSVEEVKAKFRKEFLTGDEKRMLKIREAFCEAVIKMSKNTLNKNNVLEKMEVKNLNISLDFANKLDKSPKSEVTNFALPDDNITEHEITDFFENLRFAVSQPNEKELDEIIETEIGKVNKMFSLISTPLIASKFQKFVFDWMKEKTNTCLTRKDGEKFFKDIENTLSQLSLTGQSQEFKAIIKNFDIAFNEELPELKRFLFSSKKQIFNLVNPHKSALSSIKVVSILDSIQQYKGNGSYILISLKSFLLIKNYVINAFTKLPLLVIECEGNEENIDDLFDELSTEVKNSVTKKIILITQKDNALASKFKKKFNLDKYEERNDNSNKLTDLVSESQEKLLSKGKVQFQGKDVSLKVLIDDETKKLIDGEILFKLIRGEKIEVGIKRPGLYDLESIYHVTSVKIDTQMLTGAFQKSKNDLFVFFGITKGELSQIISDQNLKVRRRICLFREDVLISEHKYVILTDDEDEEQCMEDFKEVCCDYSLVKTNKKRFSAYLIRKRDNILTWICSYNPSVYMNRKFYQVIVEMDSLEKIINKSYIYDKDREKRDIFAVSNIMKNEFENYYHIKVSNNLPTDENSVKVNHIYILDGENAEDSFRSFCDQRDLKKYYNIHWLQNKEHNSINYLIWRLSEGEVDGIRELKQIEDYEMYIDEEELRTNRTVIIAGDPGIGKSTTLAHLIGQPNESEWVIKLDLVKYEKQLGKVKNIKNIVGFIESFFSKINIGMEEKFAKSLFKYKIISQGKITFLFDGFDEITADSQETMIKLLKLLKNTKANFRITTRLHDEGSLRKFLSMPSYRFRPVTPQNQLNFLEKFFRTGLNIFHVSNDIILKRVKALYEKIEDADWQVTCTPLIMRMLAEVYREVIEKSYNCDNPEEFQDIENLSMSYVYERFMSKNFDIYLKEKAKLDYMPDYIKDKLTLVFNKDHQHLALRKLFPDYAKMLTDKYEQLSTDERNYFKSIGIVKADGSEMDLFFTHQTFTEYFVARFLLRMIKKRNDNPKYKVANKLLLFEILENKYKLIREFIDEMMIEENLVSKWKEIQDSSLVKTIGEQRIILLPDISCYCTLSGLASQLRLFVSDRSSSDSESDCSLSDSESDCSLSNAASLFGDFLESLKNFTGRDITITIEAFVQKFLEETDTEQLKTNLNLFLDVTKHQDFVGNFNEVYLLDKRSTGVMHYFNQSKQSNVGLLVEEQFIETCINTVIGEVFSNFNKVFKKFKTSPTDDNLQQLINFFIPSKEKNGVKLEEWIKLNNLYCYLEIFHPDVTERIKSYIDSEMTIQERYAERVLNSLKNTKFPRGYVINTIIAQLNLTSLQSLLLNIIDNPVINDNIKSRINTIFKNKGRNWLEKQGIFISCSLQILTDEMSERLISVLSEDNKGTAAYSKCLLEFLVWPIVDTLRKKELPHIDKVALMNMLENSFSVKFKDYMPLKGEKIKSTLNFVEKLLDEKHQDDKVLSMISNYMVSLCQVGPKLFNFEEKLTVFDSVTKFQYDFSSSHTALIIDKIRNCTKSQKNLTEKSCMKAESSGSGQKRKTSETNLTESKKPRIEMENIT